MNHTRPPKFLQTEHYFSQLEERIVKRLRTEASSDEARNSLIRSTGITDPKLIDELSTLGISAEELIAIRLIPLVLVAWADENVAPNERRVVKVEANRMGITEGSTAWLILEAWLKKHPPRICADAWKRYMHQLFSRLSRPASQRLIQLTHQQMIAVAKASGGYFGIGKISSKEQALISKLVQVMENQTF